MLWESPPPSTGVREEEPRVPRSRTPAGCAPTPCRVAGAAAAKGHEGALPALGRRGRRAGGSSPLRARLLSQGSLHSWGCHPPPATPSPLGSSLGVRHPPRDLAPRGRPGDLELRGTERVRLAGLLHHSAHGAIRGVHTCAQRSPFCCSAVFPRQEARPMTTGSLVTPTHPAWPLRGWGDSGGLSAVGGGHRLPWQPAQPSDDLQSKRRAPGAGTQPGHPNARQLQGPEGWEPGRAARPQALWGRGAVRLCRLLVTPFPSELEVTGSERGLPERTQAPLTGSQGPQAPGTGLPHGVL